MSMHQIKYNVLISIMVIVFITGCVYHKVSVYNMVEDMNAIRYSKNVALNILWYQGSDSEFVYFAYVYSMSGTKLYKVPSEQLSIDDEIEFSEDSSKWIPVSKINGEWSASRLYDGAWIEDRTGIEIQVVPSDQN